MLRGDSKRNKNNRITGEWVEQRKSERRRYGVCAVDEEIISDKEGWAGKIRAADLIFAG